MEDWKLRHIIVNFTEACEGDHSSLIKHAKTLRGVLDKLRKPQQEAELLEEIVPYLSHDSAAVRQCTFCVILNLPINGLATMPPDIRIERYDGDGNKYFDHHWVNPVPPDQHRIEWMEFAAQHMADQQDRQGYRPGR